MDSQRHFILLVGPSGSGKTSIQQALLRERSLRLRPLVTSTSRKPRQGERNGRDYWFLSRDDFEHGIKEGRFYEWALVYGEYYGSEKSRVQQAQRKNRTLLLTLDTQGAEKFKQAHPDALVIFVDAPLVGIRERLLRREMAAAEYQARLQRIAYEKRWKRRADFVVMNRDGALERAVEEIKTFIKNRTYAFGA